MEIGKWWLVGVVLVGGVALTACAESSASESTGEEPATIEAVEGTDLYRVTVTEKAVQRLGIEMVPIEAGAAATRVVPYGAIVYDPDGDTWVYTSPKPLTYVRTAVTVDDIEGDDAVLSDGPEAGTEVVSVGTAELYGSEQEIGH
jgi:hypothetical protein